MTTGWLILIGGLYLAALVIATLRARQATASNDDYMLAGSNLGAVLGCLTFGATLFSTFTLMGMPDFFRSHGIGAWIFLGVADAAVAFVILWYVRHLRRAAAASDFKGIAGLINVRYRSRWPGYLYLVGLFVFLIPYVAVQIRGIGILLNAAYPETLATWAWSLVIVVTLLIYSEIGGLKAIIYSDALQGVVLLAVTWIIAYGCVKEFGDISAMMQQVNVIEPALMSVPGPKGLFTTQFMIASLLAILALPITQPQLATRLVIMKNTAEAKKMAVAVGVFSILVILPTIAIGMFGAIRYAEASPAEFLAAVLIHDQAPYIAATVAVGLVAAAMSTADSQLFALGGELRSLLRCDEQLAMRWTRAAIAAFAACAYWFAIASTDQLVLMARVSFAGTAILAPMILLAVLARQPSAMLTLPATAFALLIFLASVLGLGPTTLFEVRLDLLLFVSVSLIALLSAKINLHATVSERGQPRS